MVFLLASIHSSDAGLVVCTGGFLVEYCWYAALLVPASAASRLALPPQPKARRSPCRGHSFRPNLRSFGSMIHKLSSLLRFAHLRFFWSVAAADAAHPLLVTFSYDASFLVVLATGLEFNRGT